jgi:transcriptional regulator with XRE-family HTH domain
MTVRSRTGDLLLTAAQGTTGGPPPIRHTGERIVIRHADRVQEISSMTAREPDLSPSARRLRRQLGRELMALRTLAGLSQRDMRDRTGLSQSVVSRIENGEAAPSNEELTAWVKAAGAKDRLDGLLALNEIVHNASAGAGTVRTFTLVDDYADSYVRVLTRQIELLIANPVTVERYRALFDQITGSALSEDSTGLTMPQGESGQAR